MALKRNSAAASFIQAFKTRVIPRLEAYRPQIILISAGFDGHKDDPSGGLKLSDEDYFTLTKLLMRVAKKFCGGKIVSVLEGGYQLERQVLKKCIHAHLRALLSDDDHVTPSQIAPVAFSPYSPSIPASESLSSNYQRLKTNGNYPPNNTSNPATQITKINKPYRFHGLPARRVFREPNSTPDTITIIDDSPSDNQQSSNKQTPPKKGSIESILL